MQNGAFIVSVNVICTFHIHVNVFQCIWATYQKTPLKGFFFFSRSTSIVAICVQTFCVPDLHVIRVCMHLKQDDSPIQYLKGGRKKERTRKKYDSYLREGKSYSNCSNNNKMVPEPVPNSIQAASNVDFTFESQTLSKRAKLSLLLIHVCGKYEIWNQFTMLLLYHINYSEPTAATNTFFLIPMLP